MTTRAQLQNKSVGELRDIARAAGIEVDGLQKAKIISALVQAGQAVESGEVSDPSFDPSVELPIATPRTEEPAGQNGSNDGAEEDGPHRPASDDVSSGGSVESNDDGHEGSGEYRGDWDRGGDRGDGDPGNRNRRKRRRRSGSGGGGGGGGGGGTYTRTPG
jgi:hypothetical protein